ncbi:MAG: protein kinase, partial [Planctomycetes bacterium]|nr:protein kinase [Planctomycetota bacterium]
MTDTFESLKAALADRYAIEQEVGSGGMATVYLARDLKHDRHVAIKVLRPELAAAIGPERFIREIKITAQLNHPHILPLLDSGDAEGFLFYVMPYVEGESLRDRLNRDKQLSIEDSIKIASEVADALNSAHKHDVIHRDIKPENILLEEGHAVVADFGIARVITAAGAERLTETGLAIGTPAYMSPEQASGEDQLDGRSDIYSLGCVLYEMLAGEPPHTGPSVQAIIARKLSEPVRRLRAVRESIPVAVEELTMKALSRVPADRFATAAAMAGALANPTTLSTAAMQSIVVLPFDSLSPDKENEYFADGLTEELIADLSKIQTLRVISRTSAMTLKGRERDVRSIGRELDVRYVLEGSVRRAGNNLRVTAQLIDAMNDAHLWAE